MEAGLPARRAAGSPRSARGILEDVEAPGRRCGAVRPGAGTVRSAQSYLFRLRNGSLTRVGPYSESRRLPLTLMTLSSGHAA